MKNEKTKFASFIEKITLAIFENFPKNFQIFSIIFPTSDCLKKIREIFKNCQSNFLDERSKFGFSFFNFSRFLVLRFFGFAIWNVTLDPELAIFQNSHETIFGNPHMYMTTLSMIDIMSRHQFSQITYISRWCIWSHVFFRGRKLLL